MAGYTRQSTASIINGSSITAPPINAEFNQLLAAFNAASGHGHTGGTGDAPKIPLTTSVSGYLPLVHGGVGGRNNVTNSVPTANDDSGDGYAPGSIWENSATGRVYICVGNSSGAAVWRELVQVDSGNAILPASNNTVDLGNNSTRFQDLFLSGGIAAAGNVAIGGTLTTTGTSAFTGLATFANLSATGTTTITSVDLNSGAIDNAVIGSATPATGTFTTLNANTSLVAATADINGGTIDGAALGGTTPSTGSFTTLGASGTSTLTTVDINGGNIDGTIIGASTTAAGSFTTLSTTGQATLASADINGGSIDGSTIGANSASTGAFTTLTSSGGITGSLTGNVTGNTAGVHTGAVTGNVTGNLTGNVTAGSGTSTFTNLVVNGNLNMNAGTSATITNLTAPSSDLDAATKKYVDDEISTLIGDAGAGLDTLGELADALNDDDAFSTTVTNSIATKLPKAGGTMTGAIAMSTNKITGAGDPTSAQDVATKAYTDTQRDTRVAKTGDTMSGALAMGNNKITGLGTPTATTDATTKTYVDGLFQSTTAAATSATNAATSETNAATSETNASNSAAAALTSKNAAATSLSTFQNQYLGAQSSAPTQDPDGSALDVGDLYFDTVANAMKVYSSSGWTNAGSSVNGTSNRVTYTATAGQTVFAATYDSGYIDAFLNGVKLLAGTDFTATNGTSITLASGASVNDVVDIVAYGTFELADHYTRTASDARYVEVAGDTMTGALTTTGLTVDGGSNGTIDFGDVTTAYGRLYADNTGTFVGSKTNQPLILRTNNAEAMRIDSSGKVGIGTTSPSSLLHLSDASSPTITLTDTTNNRSLKLFHSNNDAIIESSTNSSLTFRTNGATERMRIDTSGKVGIGTSSPSPDYGSDVALEIKGASSPGLVLNDTGQASKYGIHADSNDLKITYGTGALATFQNDGKVGIGTSSPIAKLHVSNGGAEGLEINPSGGTVYLTGYNRSGGAYAPISLIGSGGGTLTIGSGGSSFNNNVGIGTSSPDAIFTVDTNVGGSSTGTLARFHASKGESDSTFLQIAATRHGTASVQRVQLQAFDDDGSTGRTLALNPSGGSVGIGTNSPSTKLTILANSANGIDLAQDPDDGTNSGRLFFTTSGGSNSIRSTSGALQFSTGATAGSSSGTERMKIDASGRVTKPYQPAFLVTTTTTTVTTSSGAWANITMNSETYDTGGNFASNTFTAPVTGKYQMNVQLLVSAIDTAANYYVLDCSTSNRNYHYLMYPTNLLSADTSFQFIWSFVADMDQGDTAFLRINQNGGTFNQTTVLADSNYTKWSGYMLG